jgi:hypothetical protein
MAVFKSPNDEFATGKASLNTSLGSLTMSAYERTASWLIAFLWLCGSLTVCLILMWLGQTLRFEVKSYDLTVEEEGYGRGDNPAGFARDSKAPGDPELAQLDEPAGSELYEVAEDQSLAPTTVIDEAVAASIAEVGDIAVDTVGTGRVAGFSTGRGGGEGGLGDNRPPGPLGDGVNVIPRWDRWEIQFISTSVTAYARQLDFFGIELGAIGGKKEIDYAKNLAKSSPDRRSGLPKDEKRMYMAWRRGTLKAFDEQLLQRANIDTTGRLLVQFIPPDTEKLLATLELRNAGGKSVKEFYKTIFGVRQAGTGWEFFIVDQKFRTVLSRT